MKSILHFKGRFFTALAVFTLLVMASCNKRFDEPPLNADPDISVTMTIAQLKGKYAAIGNFQTMQEDKVISGIVTADDRTGNFFKQIVIQDETGGIPIKIDVNSLYTMYPVGRRVYVKLKGLMLGDYGGTIQLGLDSTRSADGRYLNIGGIPEILLNTYIVKGSFGNAITPKIVKPSEFTGAISDPLISAFVQINAAEFKEADLAKTYANATNATTESARSFTIKPCNDTKSIVLRNSSYASFAGLNVPQGNGSLLGIASVFNGTVQITVRDTSDLQFKGTRCNGQGAAAITKTIAEVLQYAKGDSAIPSGVWIEGVIISDTKNETAGNYRLQDGASGIQIRFATGSNPASGALGNKLKVYVGGYKFSQFGGGLQIEGSDVSINTGNGTITPRIATIAEVLANLRAWESTVVTIKNVTFEGGNTIKDGTGQIATFVRTTSGITLPDKADSVTGYVSYYNVPQLILRTPADIGGGITVPAETGSFTATYDFASLLNNSGTSDPTTPPTVKNLTFSNFTAVGVSANPSTGGRFSYTLWPIGATNDNNTTFNGSVDVSKYYEVTITPASGFKLDLSKMTFTIQRSGTGIRHAVVRSSIDNFVSNLPASVVSGSANLSVVNTNVFQLLDASSSAENGSTITFGSAFTNVTTPVTLRFYGYDAESTAGTFSIDNVAISGTTR